MNGDLWKVMQADHDLIWAFLNQLTGGSGDPEGTPAKHRMVARMLVALSSSHEAAEEMVIWPAVRRACAGGDELAARGQEQEGRAKRALNELAHIAPGTEEFEACVHTIAGLTRAHITYEQNQIWPGLAGRLSPADAGQLARQWRTARRWGPTRPHPHTPARPFVLATAGVVVSTVDRARDKLARRHLPSP